MRAGYDHSNVPRLEPAVLGEGLLGLLLVLVVAWDDIASSDPDLSSWRWPSLLVLVSREVLHLWHINELELVLGKAASYMPEFGVVLVAHKLASHGFSLTVAFCKGAAESDFQELSYRARHRGGPGEAVLHSTSKSGLHLLEDQLIIEEVGHTAVNLVVLGFGLNRSSSNFALDSGGASDALLDNVMELVVHSGH